MSRHLIARLMSAFAIAALLLGALAIPVAAASQTRLVDDGAQCPTAAYTSIQEAIDDSAAGDKVFVCPGHYAEQLTIDKAILVRAYPLFQAHIDVPLTLAPVDGVVAAVYISADNATFRGFRMHIEAGEAIIFNARPSALSCAHVDAAIYVLGLQDKVAQNRIDVDGPATLNGPCGYDYGIVVGQHPVAAGVRPTGEALGSATARLTFNKIEDFKVGGILIEGEDSYAFVRRNAIKYLHLDDPGCVIFSVIPCGPISATNEVLNGVFIDSFGIGVEGGAEADIIRNAIRSGPNAGAGAPSVIVGTPMLNAGISLHSLDSSESNTVFHNAVWRVATGVFTLSGAAGAEISYNHVTNSNVALKAADSGDDWHHNHVHNNLIGILANFGNNNFHDNIAEANTQYDCYDSTLGSGTDGTANTWTSNVGALSYPDDICDDSI